MQDWTERARFDAEWGTQEARSIVIARLDPAESSVSPSVSHNALSPGNTLSICSATLRESTSSNWVAVQARTRSRFVNAEHMSSAWTCHRNLSRWPNKG